MNPPPKASLMVAAFEKGVCIKVIGRANFILSVDFRNLFNELWAHGYALFIFDLSECVNMDSTFLGAMTEVALKFVNARKIGDVRHVKLHNPQPRVVEALETVCIDALFKAVADPAVSADQVQVEAQTFQTVEPTANVSKVEITRACLKAHQTLMDINPENIKKFKDVVQFLAEDLKRLESENPKPEPPKPDNDPKPGDSAQ
jgi:hypothetical protein